MKMGMNRFEEGYIECFEKMATNKHDQSLRVKEIEKTLLSKEFQNQHFDIIMDEVKTICNSTCEAIDTHFENLTATINSLKNVLMWKSQVQLIPEKLARVLNPIAVQVNNSQEPPNSDSCFSSVNDSSQNKNDRKCGTAKVSPMIKGHVISAPRIHLNRLCKNYGSGSRHPFANKLSPIMEQSPNTKSHESPSPHFRNIQIPLKRLKIGNFAGKTAESEDSNGVDNSPKINFTGRNCAGFELRRRYSSLGENERFRMMRHRRAEVVNGNKHDEEVAEDRMNEENTSFRSEGVENYDLNDKSRRNINDDDDPLEGPSWLLNKQQIPEESDNSGLSSCHFKYVNFNRLNYVRSNRALSDETQTTNVSDFNDEAQMGNFGLNSNEQEEIKENSSLGNETSEKNCFNEDEESSFEQPSSSATERPEGYDKFYTSALDRSSSSSSSNSSESRSGVKRNSVNQKDESSVLTESESASRKSNRSGRLSNRRNSSNCGNKSLTPRLSMNCYVNLKKLRLEKDMKRLEENRSFTVDPTSTGRKSKERSAQRKQSSRGIRKTPESEVPDERLRGSVSLRRTKRRAAEHCIQKKVWVDVTPKWEAKIRRKKVGRGTGSVVKKSKKRTMESVE